MSDTHTHTKQRVKDNKTEITFSDQIKDTVKNCGGRKLKYDRQSFVCNSLKNYDPRRDNIERTQLLKIFSFVSFSVYVSEL